MRPRAITLYTDLFAFSNKLREDTALLERGKEFSQNDPRLWCGSNDDLGKSIKVIFESSIAVLDWLGIVVFTISGALVASRNQMDVIGFILLGTVTGIGGGRSVISCSTVNRCSGWIVRSISGCV